MCYLYVLPLVFFPPLLFHPVYIHTLHPALLHHHCPTPSLQHPGITLIACLADSMSERKGGRGRHSESKSVFVWQPGDACFSIVSALNRQRSHSKWKMNLPVKYLTSKLVYLLILGDWIGGDSFGVLCALFNLCCTFSSCKFNWFASLCKTDAAQVSDGTAVHTCCRSCNVLPRALRANFQIWL